MTFALVALAVAAHRVPYFTVDLALSRAIQGMNLSGLDFALRFLNALGFPPVVGIAYGLVIAAIFVAGARWEATASTFAVLGGMALNNGTKMLVDRPRPSMDLIHVEHHISSSTFPAGHVLNFTVFAGFLCCLSLLHMAPSWTRTTVAALLIAMIVLMGVARIDSGEHWASDVLGGYLLGAIWLVVTLEFYRWGRRRWNAGRAKTVGAALAGSRLLLLGIPLALSAWITPAGAADADSSSTAGPEPDGLAASVDAPWNPPHRLAPRHLWEQVVILPGRLVSLPLAGLGYVARQSVRSIEAGGWIPAGSQPGKPAPRRPLSLQLPHLGDRTGLGGAAELRLGGSHAPVPLVSARYTATLLRYNSTLLTVAQGPLALQYGYDWRPQDQFYGIGNSSSLDSLSGFASQDEFARGRLHFGWGRESRTGSPRAQFSLWGGPRSVVTRSGRESGRTSYDVRFPSLGAATLDRRVEHLVYGASLTTDWRSGVPHWGRGVRVQLAAERYDPPIRALALNTSRLEGAPFTKYTFEGEAGVSFMRDPRTLRVMLRVNDEQADSGRDRFLLSDYSRLGGSDGLAGFGSGRFRDLDLLLTRVTYLFPLARLFECEVHSEWGAVYADVWNDAGLRTMKNSYGFSLRARSDHSLRGALGLDFSREGARIRYALGSVE